MGDVVEFLGWIGAGAASGALLNFVVKLVGRTWIKAVPAKYARQVGWYRSFMRFMVQRHRVFGIMAFAFVLVHAALVVLGSMLSLTGSAAAAALTATASLGAYGFYVKKDPRAGWLPVHRACAAILLLAVIAHIVYRWPVVL